MKFILLILYFVLVYNIPDNTTNSVIQKENQMHLDFYECIVNNTTLNEGLRTILEKNKLKVETEKKRLRIGRILPKFSSLNDSDKEIIMRCKQEIFDKKQ